MYINFRKVQIYRNHKTPLYYNQLEIFFIIYPLCKDTQYYYNGKVLQQFFLFRAIGLYDHAPTLSFSFSILLSFSSSSLLWSYNYHYI